MTIWITKKLTKGIYTFTYVYDILNALVWLKTEDWKSHSPAAKTLGIKPLFKHCTTYCIPLRLPISRMLFMTIGRPANCAEQSTSGKDIYQETPFQERESWRSNLKLLVTSPPSWLSRKHQYIISSDSESERARASSRWAFYGDCSWWSWLIYCTVAAERRWLFLRLFTCSYILTMLLLISVTRTRALTCRRPNTLFTVTLLCLCDCMILTAHRVSRIALHLIQVCLCIIVIHISLSYSLALSGVFSRHFI